jgi:hypothetical protein
MKYHSVILLLMAAIIVAFVVIGLIVVGFVNINQQSAVDLPQTTPISQTARPTPRPTTLQTQSTQDPIVGSWLNGMVFYANGTVGSDGSTSWKVNEDENNSYFVISDTTTEWIYNAESDMIHRRGSTESFSRGIPRPTPKPTTKPTLTTMQTQLTQGTIAPTTSGPFNLEECLGICKINYSVDKNIGLYNDCVQTCNIDNLKVRT